MLKLTVHAQSRLQQRGIPLIALDHLFEYGSFIYDKHGCIKYFFTQKDICISQTGKEIKLLENFKNVYLICDFSGVIITCGHLTKKIMRS